MMTARLITLEGGEGVGKSTNLAFIADCLRQSGDEVVLTREPGGTPLAEELRALLLAQRSEAVAPLTELLTLFAARAQHWQAVIVPALARGAWVLSDRFIDATYAYQVGGRELDSHAVKTLQQLVLGTHLPGLTLLLDAPIAIGMARAKARAATDRFEAEQSAFFERVRAQYLVRAEAEPSRIRVIDASKSLAQVQAQLAAELTRYQHRLAANESALTLINPQVEQ